MEKKLFEAGFKGPFTYKEAQGQNIPQDMDFFKKWNNEQFEKRRHREREIAENNYSNKEPAIGDVIEVKNGIFSKFIGEISEVDSERKRAIVDIYIFGRPVPVVLGFDEMDPASENEGDYNRKGFEHSRSNKDNIHDISQLDARNQKIRDYIKENDWKNPSEEEVSRMNRDLGF